MIRKPQRATRGRSSAASDVYKRRERPRPRRRRREECRTCHRPSDISRRRSDTRSGRGTACCRSWRIPVSYTHLRAHETVLDLVCRLLLEKKKKKKKK